MMCNYVFRERYNYGAFSSNTFYLPHVQPLELASIKSSEYMQMPFLTTAEVFALSGPRAMKNGLQTT